MLIILKNTQFDALGKTVIDSLGDILINPESVKEFKSGLDSDTAVAIAKQLLENDISFSGTAVSKIEDALEKDLS